MTLSPSSPIQRLPHIHRRLNRKGQLNQKNWTNQHGIAAKVSRQSLYLHTAYYDAVIANWLAQEQGDAFPETITMPARLKEVCRYGENPHQTAAIYTPTVPPSQKQIGVCSAHQLQGKALSYNNYNDADAAFALVSEFSDPSVVIVKHANPCVVASAPSLASDAWRPSQALACVIRGTFSLWGDYCGGQSSFRS